MLVNDKLANYNSVAHHGGADLAQSGNTALAAQQSSDVAKAGKAPQQQAANSASVVSISYEAGIMRQTASQIMQNYNLEAITPRQIMQLSNQLFETQVISLKQHSLLSFQPDMREDYEQVFGDSGRPRQPDTTTNLMSDWRELLESKENGGALNRMDLMNTKDMVRLINNLQATRH